MYANKRHSWPAAANFAVADFDLQLKKMDVYETNFSHFIFSKLLAGCKIFFLQNKFLPRYAFLSTTHFATITM